MTVPIIYNVGAYGTYLQWCLAGICSSDDLTSPFGKNGNSHHSRGYHLNGMQNWRKYLQQDQHSQFVKLHAKTKKNESLSDQLNEILQSVDKIIICYPDSESVLLNINNWVYKIWDDWWLHVWSNSLELCVDIKTLYNNWPIAPGTLIENIDQWIRREFLSLYLIPAWRSQVEWYFPDQWQSPRCRYVFIKNLLHDFENTITDLVDFLQLDIRQPISNLLPYHEQNIKLQKYINQDSICNQIIDLTLTDKDMEWDPLPLPSEVWIQYRLRELGYEIRCHGLDIFPTTSVQLKKLLYTP